MSRISLDAGSSSQPYATMADPAARYPSPPMSPPRTSGSLIPPPVTTTTRHRPASHQQTTATSASASSRQQYSAASQHQQQQQYAHHQHSQHQQQPHHPQPSASVSSRKRASYNPSAQLNPSPPRTHPVSVHPAIAAYMREHPRRALLNFGPYVLLQTLGEGEFGKVKLGVHTEFGEEVAVKLIKRGNLDTEVRMSKVEREIDVLKVVKHPNIVRLFDVIETDKYIGIILEFANGGELFDHILAHRYLKERDACKLFAQLVSGVHYLHSKKIVHRDLKLENLLLDKGRNVIITDFGFANKFEHSSDDLMSTSCGSPCYAAPELVISEGLYVGSAVDIWSCGVILYAMLSGYLPFDDDPANPDGDNINLLYRYIINTPLQFPSHLSPEARDLLAIMLVPDPLQRAPLEIVMRHPWLAPHAALFDRSIAELEQISNAEHREKRLQSRREMQARKRAAEEIAAAERRQQQGEFQPVGGGGAGGATEISRSKTARPGTLAGHEAVRVKQSRHQSALPSTTTMPDVYLSSEPGPAAATIAAAISTSAPSAANALLDIGIDPFAAGERTSWISSDSRSANGSGARDSDFFLAEGNARGEPRSRVESAASGSSSRIPIRTTEVPSSSPVGSTRQKKQRHTIQLEYDQPAEPMITHSRASSQTSRQRTSSVLSNSPRLISDPSLSPPMTSPVHGEIAILYPSSSSASALDAALASVPSTPLEEDVPPPLLPVTASAQQDIRMASPVPPTKVEEFPSMPEEPMAVEPSHPDAAAPSSEPAVASAAAIPSAPGPAAAAPSSSASTIVPTEVAKALALTPSESVMPEALRVVKMSQISTAPTESSTHSSGVVSVAASTRTSSSHHRRTSSKIPTPIKTSSAAAAANGSSASASSRAKKGMSMDKFGLGSLLGNRSSTNVPALVDEHGSKAGVAAKKDRRKTLTLMVTDHITRSTSTRDKNTSSSTSNRASVLTSSVNGGGADTSARHASPRPGSRQSVMGAPPSATPTTPGPTPSSSSSRPSAVPFRPTDLNARPLAQTSNTPSTSTKASTGPAKKVMDWFRKKSLASSTSSTGTAAAGAFGNDHSNRHLPDTTESFVSVNVPGSTPPRPSAGGAAAAPRASVAPKESSLSKASAADSSMTTTTPAVVVTTTKGATAALTSPTTSTAPSSYKVLPPTSEAAPCSARDVAETPAMAPPSGVWSRVNSEVPPSAAAAATFKDSLLRYHAGVMDKKAMTDRPPPAVLAQVLGVLNDMGLEVKKEGEFKLKVTRPRRVSSPSAYAAAGGGAHGSLNGRANVGLGLLGQDGGVKGSNSGGVTDKRGNALPSTPSGSLLPSGLKGFMMRRGSSYSSTAPTVSSLSPLQQQQSGDDVTLSARDASPSVSSIASPTLSASNDGGAAATRSSPLYPDPAHDSGEEVRFSVEITRLRGLPGLYSVDFKRLKGPLWTYAWIYQKLLEVCDFEGDMGKKVSAAVGTAV